MRAAGPDSLGRLLVARLAAAGEVRGPVTVRDLVEALIPYRLVRSALGLTMKGEYDLGVLHLLHSDEHVRVDAELAGAVERELASPEPDLAFLAELGEARVEVRPEAWVSWSAEAAPGALAGRGFELSLQTSASREVSTGAPATAGPRPHAWAQQDGTEREPDAAPEDGAWREHAGGPTRPSTRAASASERCRHCQRMLPERGELQFCPYCGAEQVDPTCVDCDEPLERGWAFCPRCGKATEK